MTEQEPARARFLDTKCDSISQQVFQRSPPRSSHGKRWLASYYGFWRALQMNEDLLNSLMANFEKTWLGELQYGLLTQTPKVKPSAMSTTSLQKSWGPFMARNGDISTTMTINTLERTKSQPYLTSLELIQIQDESFYQHGT